MANDQMPMVPFGKYTISRLIAGSNPLNGGSHTNRFLSAHMARYFTRERQIEHLRHCEELGINIFQSHPGNVDLYRAIVEQGSKMHFISLGMDKKEDPEMLDRIVSAGTIGVAHHGEYTDINYKNGTIEQVHEYCKKVRDTGLMVGISTHMPDVVKYVLDHGWDVDFFMCCVYERQRNREELTKLFGPHIPVPIPEVYLESDPPRMFEVMRQTEKPCLAFKILAAGRLCETQDVVEQAFKRTLEQIKPTDAVIVGMYPEFEDQPALNVSYVKKYS